MDEQQLTPALKLEATHIRMARVGVKLSIRELAELVRINKATIVRIEAGKPVRENTLNSCLLYTSPSPRDRTRSRMPSSA